VGEPARVLVVKLSSLGDILHTLPALTDARRALPGVRFDWVIEEGFLQVPRWHPAVEQVIPVAFRRWRKRPQKELFGQEWRAARRAIGRQQYDCVIDAQGLIKSAIVTRLARGRRCGQDRRSAREGLAALAYDERFFVPRDLHAIERTRRLFAAALAYRLPAGEPEAGIDTRFPGDAGAVRPGVWLLHGTAREEKTWPEAHWVSLAQRILRAGYGVVLAAGNEEEEARAQRIAHACRQNTGGGNVQLVPRASLDQLAAYLSTAVAAVAVDTGLGHLAAALNIPAVSLYGPTDPALVGTCGMKQSHLCAPGADMSGIASGVVWNELARWLPRAQQSG